MNFVVLHTGAGRQYARVIARSLKWIATKKKKSIRTFVIPVSDVSEFFEQHTELLPKETIIHPRAAHPSEVGWMQTLFSLEEKGFRIINSPAALRLTSDKLAGALKLQATIAHPHTWKVTGGETMSTIPNGRYVLKPQTSMEQGARVTKLVKKDDGFHLLENDVAAKVVSLDAILRDKIGERNALLQEWVDYDSLYRVIVLNGTAFPYSFVDKPEYHPNEWKVSVCLNKTSMQFVSNPDPVLLRLAESAQTIVGAKISFVDIFRTRQGEYTMSEINTACNLSIHERLAKAALGENGPWNIHYRISKTLWELAFS